MSTKRDRVRRKTDSATPSTINILARTEDDQVSIIVRATYLYNFLSNVVTNKTCLILPIFANGKHHFPAQNTPGRKDLD